MVYARFFCNEICGFFIYRLFALFFKFIKGNISMLDNTPSDLLSCSGIQLFWL